MGLRHRSLLSAATVALSFALVGCDTADTLDKLSDMIPFGENKKPLPGERKEVFPQGVPGVPQGVPPDLVKGNQPPPDAAPPPQQAAVPPPAEKPKPKRKLQAKPKAPPQAPADQSAQTVPPTQQMQAPQATSTWPPPMQPTSGWPSQTPSAAPKQ
jgi:hypothetical protein